TRRQHQEGEADDSDQRQACDIEHTSVHRPLRKKRPVMPCGNRRIRTMAAASRATSPNTGVVAKVAIWLMVPNKAAADIVPLRKAEPPPITVMKDLATLATPMVGKTPETGASTAPARPDIAA